MAEASRSPPCSFSGAGIACPGRNPRCGPRRRSRYFGTPKPSSAVHRRSCRVTTCGAFPATTLAATSDPLQGVAGQPPGGFLPGTRRQRMASASSRESATHRPASGPRLETRRGRPRQRARRRPRTGAAPRTRYRGSSRGHAPGRPDGPASRHGSGRRKRRRRRDEVPSPGAGDGRRYRRPPP